MIQGKKDRSITLENGYKMITLTRDQISQVMLHEIEYNLTIMKQYLTPEETNAYLIILERYGSLIQRDYVLMQYEKAWG